MGRCLLWVSPYYGQVLINFTLELQHFLELSQQDPNDIQRCSINTPTVSQTLEPHRI